MLSRFAEYYAEKIKPYEKGYNIRIKNALKNDKLREKNLDYGFWCFGILSFLASLCLASFYLSMDNFCLIDEERIIKNGLSEGELYYNIKNIEQIITLFKNTFKNI